MHSLYSEAKSSCGVPRVTCRGANLGNDLMKHKYLAPNSSKERTEEHVATEGTGAGGEEN